MCSYADAVVSLRTNENPLSKVSELHLSNGSDVEATNNTADEETEAGAKPIASDAADTTSPSFWCSVRFLVITLLGFLGTVNLFAMRVNLSIALPCMVFINDTPSDPDPSAQLNSSSFTTTMSSASGCVRPPLADTTNTSSLKFEWSGQTKGLVNGFFFVGYLFFQIPSALLASRFGAKRVMLASMSLCTLSNLVQHPFALLLGRDAAHWSFIVLRFLNGVGSATFFPVYTALLANWAPPLERSRMLSTAYAGANAGIALTFAAGGYLCKSLGWPALFYIPGAMSIAWLVLWTALVADSPEKHRWIRAAEREYIRATQGRATQQNGNGPDERALLALSEPPEPEKLKTRVHSNMQLIRQVLTSPCVYALWVAHVTCEFGDFTFLTNIPSFMHEVLFFDIEANGLLSALPYVLFWFVITAVGHLVDLLLDRKLVRLLVVRKAANTIGLGGSAIVVCFLALTDCSRPVWALVILSAAVSFEGFCYSGFYVNYIEVAPRHSGAIYAVGNSLAAIAGFVGPFLVGWITSNHTHAEWNIAFFMCAGVMAVGALVYLVFARADLQPWARAGLRPESESAAEPSQSSAHHNNS